MILPSKQDLNLSRRTKVSPLNNTGYHHRGHCMVSKLGVVHLNLILQVNKKKSKSQDTKTCNCYFESNIAKYNMYKHTGCST